MEAATTASLALVLALRLRDIATSRAQHPFPRATAAENYDRAHHQIHAGPRADSEQDTTNNIYSSQQKLRIKLSRARQPMPCESTHESHLVPSASDWHTANSLQSP